jgi:hypothetical protein
MFKQRTKEILFQPVSSPSPMTLNLQTRAFAPNNSLERESLQKDDIFKANKSYVPENLLEKLISTTKSESSTCPVQRKSQNRLKKVQSQRMAIQAKLNIGEPNDKYEQEADETASKVVQQINSTSQDKSVQKQEAMEEDEELQMKSLVQRREILGGGEASTDLESSIQSARGSGQSLEPNLQAKIGTTGQRNLAKAADASPKLQMESLNQNNQVLLVQARMSDNVGDWQKVSQVFGRKRPKYFKSIDKFIDKQGDSLNELVYLNHLEQKCDRALEVVKGKNNLYNSHDQKVLNSLKAEIEETRQSRKAEIEETRQSRKAEIEETRQSRIEKERKRLKKEDFQQKGLKGTTVGMENFLDTLDPETVNEYRELAKVSGKDDLKTGRLIGRGAFGAVFSAEKRDEPTKKYAVKDFSMSYKGGYDEKKLERKRAVYIPLIAKELGFNHMPLTVSQEQEVVEQRDKKGSGIVSHLALGENASKLLDYEESVSDRDDLGGMTKDQQNLAKIMKVDEQRIQDTMIFDMLFEYQDGWAAQYMIDDKGTLTKIDNDDYGLAKGSNHRGEKSSSFVAGLPQANRLLTKETKDRIRNIDLKDLEGMLAAAQYKAKNNKDNPKRESLFDAKAVERAKRNLADLQLLIEIGDKCKGLSARELFDFYNSRDKEGNLAPNSSTKEDYAAAVKMATKQSEAFPSQVYNAFGNVADNRQLLGQRANGKLHEVLGERDMKEQLDLVAERGALDKDKFNQLLQDELERRSKN